MEIVNYHDDVDDDVEAAAKAVATVTVTLVINKYYIHKLTVNVKNLRAPLYFAHMKWCVV